jgi:hypothetical protein
MLSRMEYRDPLHERSKSEVSFKHQETGRAVKDHADSKHI